MTWLVGRRYLFFLEEVLTEILQDSPIAIGNRLWLQRDRLPDNFSTALRNYLDASFGA